MLNKTSNQQGNQNLSTLRTIVTSPKKKRHPTHAKLHTAIIRSPENVKFIMEPPAKKASHNNTVSAIHNSKQKNMKIKHSK